MKQKILFFIIAIFIIIIDQAIKLWILNLAKTTNPIFETNFIDIILVYNKGMAFSLGSFLGVSLKWIILLLLIITSILVIKSKDFFNKYYIALGAIIGAGFGNVIDRFIRDGVVDYIYWHYGFKFAVFNFADSIINIAIIYLLLDYVYNSYKTRKPKIN
ncbi:signal peptidase II [Helicobacter sp. MIT 99-5507]|uniref:signal peptidase II n=1 Tax=Helicobacter sp. MIT 99-5507 TaxID=152489 RepID=UPI000E1E8874|nr:signal peptidase II [Helicobacter sp. MIT 99-5507]RDU58467.1 lipoprotein signal peptidase [Helicobacter sp. MIT 99-5507]